MATGSRGTTGNLLRMLQYGVDEILTGQEEYYKDPMESYFTTKESEKQFYEALFVAGMSPAQELGEGENITTDTMDQYGSKLVPLTVYSKAARFSYLAKNFNLYWDLMPEYTKEMMEAMKQARGYNMSVIFNNSNNSAAAYQGYDSQPLCSASHVLQTGQTTSNILNPLMNLNADALEAARLVVDNILAPNGNPTDLDMGTLITGPKLRGVAMALGLSDKKVGTADNDINIVKKGSGYMSDMMVWKRITSPTAWWLTTNNKKTLMCAKNGSPKTEQSNDPYNFDAIIAVMEIYRYFFQDFRGLVQGQS